MAILDRLRSQDEVIETQLKQTLEKESREMMAKYLNEDQSSREKLKVILERKMQEAIASRRPTSLLVEELIKAETMKQMAEYSEKLASEKTSLLSVLTKDSPAQLDTIEALVDQDIKKKLEAYRAKLEEIDNATMRESESQVRDRKNFERFLAMATSEWTTTCTRISASLEKMMEEFDSNAVKQLKDGNEKFSAIFAGVLTPFSEDDVEDLIREREKARSESIAKMRAQKVKEFQKVLQANFRANAGMLARLECQSIADFERRIALPS